MLSGDAAKSHPNRLERADESRFAKRPATGIDSPGNVNGVPRDSDRFVEAMILQLQIRRNKVDSIAVFINHIAIKLHRIGIDRSLAFAGVAAPLSRKKKS